MLKSKTGKSILVAGGVFILLTGILWIQAGYTEGRDIRYAARTMLKRTLHILHEAELATREAQKIVSPGCTEAERDQLNNIVAGYPHLHSVTLVKQNITRCSSLTGRQNHDLSEIHFTERTLSLFLYRPPSHSGQGYPLLVLATPQSPTVRIDAAINGLFLQNRLNALSDSRRLWLRVGEQVMDASGNITPLNALPADSTTELADTRVPVSVLYYRHSSLTLIDFIKTWPLFLLASLLLSFIAGALHYRWYNHRIPARETLLQALRDGEFRTVYQSVIGSDNGKIVGFEALCRWYHPKEGTVSPDIFIPLAEQCGIITLLTQYQLEQIQRDASKIASLAGDTFYISVNFSRQHYTSGTFIHDCRHFIRTLKPLGGQLIIEITEREPMDLSPAQLEKFAWLRQAGAGIALDDFGTGYSNLSYLPSLKPDYLKIDKMFVSHMEPGHTTLLDCVIDLANSLGIHTIAEGVETEEQAKYLSARRVDSQQGYYWYHPMDMQTLVSTLSKAP